MKLTPNSSPFRYDLGMRGEVAAADYLVKLGFKILEKNYRCKIGEIDLIVQKDGELSFVEVKTRSSDHYGRPEEAVQESKQKKIIRLAQWYLKENPKISGRVGFAVMSVTAQQNADYEIRFYPHAFSLPDENDRKFESFS